MYAAQRKQERKDQSGDPFKSLENEEPNKVAQDLLNLTYSPAAQFKRKTLLDKGRMKSEIKNS